MENIITRNIFMAVGAWSVAILGEAGHSPYGLAAGITVGGLLFCLLAWSQSRGW
jgi:hypothetical protein